MIHITIQDFVDSIYMSGPMDSGVFFKKNLIIFWFLESD